MFTIFRLSSAFLLLLFLTGISIAQRTQQPAQPQTAPSPTAQTKLETFQGQRGAVIIKGYTDVGSITGTGGTASVTSYEFQDAQTGRREYGIGIEVKENGRLEREDRSFIDYDEIDSLLKGIDYIGKADGRITNLANFEAAYVTRGDFSVTTFNGQRGETRVAISSGRIGRVSIYLPIEKLVDFRKLIVDAKTALDTVKK